MQRAHHEIFHTNLGCLYVVLYRYVSRVMQSFVLRATDRTDSGSFLEPHRYYLCVVVVVAVYKLSFA